MTKDIYIIKNTINNKVYIGQTKNCADRWSKHIWSAKHRPHTAIAQAMHDLGIQHFYYQVLEHEIENFDERERYWIEYYDSRVPNGYNVAPGGRYVGGTEAATASITDTKTLQHIVDDLQTTRMSYAKLAEKYECCEWTIGAINHGEAYYNADLHYPLRESNRYTEEKLKQLRYSLKYELDKSLKDLAREYQMDAGEISNINQGHTHRIAGENYPLRNGKVTFTLCSIVDEVIALLKTDMPQQDIARQYNVSVSSISGINTGKNYRRPNETYPIRDNYQGQSKRNCFSPDEVRQIEHELRTTTLSMRKLAAKYECTLTEIMNINNGSVKKYRSQDVLYPVRKSFCNDYPRIAE